MNRARLGDVEFDVLLNENPIDSAEITEYAVEDGRTFVDHHAILPSTLNITGVFAREGSDKQLSTLKQYQRDAEILTYYGRNIYYNMTILTIDRNHQRDNKYGFAYDITLQEVPIQQSQRITLDVKPPIQSSKEKNAEKKIKTKTKNTTSKGKQQTKTRVVNKANTKQRKKVTDKILTKNNTVSAKQFRKQKQKREREKTRAKMFPKQKKKWRFW